MKVDLHCHTKISDNSLSIREVIQLAKKNNVSHLAITDHDTTKGIKEALYIGKEIGVEIIPGIEISAYDFQRNKRAHILGYYIQPGHPSINVICEPMIKKRHEISKQMVEQIIRAGFTISWEQVEKYAEGGTGVYKQHIMHALIEAGYEEMIYGPLYKQLFSRGDQDHGKGIAFVELEYIDVKKAIKAVKEAGGIAVIAHPGQMDNYEAIPEWVELGLEGIEMYHHDHSKNDLVRCQQLARQFNLVITGGSDFHGYYDTTSNTVGLNSPGLESVIALQQRLQN